MLKVHTSDGQTRCVDLRNDEQAQELLTKLKDPNFQAEIRGITVVQNISAKCSKCDEQIRWKGFQHTLSPPEGFGKVFFHVENLEPNLENKIKGGEKVVCFVDDVRVTLMAHKANPAVRFSLRKMGHQRYNPLVGL